MLCAISIVPLQKTLQTFLYFLVCPQWRKILSEVNFKNDFDDCSCAEDAELTLLFVFRQLFSFPREFHPQIFKIEQVDLLDQRTKFLWITTLVSMQQRQIAQLTKHFQLPHQCSDGPSPSQPCQPVTIFCSFTRLSILSTWFNCFTRLTSFTGFTSFIRLTRFILVH